MASHLFGWRIESVPVSRRNILRAVQNEPWDCSGSKLGEACRYRPSELLLACAYTVEYACPDLAERLVLPRDERSGKLPDGNLAERKFRLPLRPFAHWAVERRVSLKHRCRCRAGRCFGSCGSVSAHQSHLALFPQARSI